MNEQGMKGRKHRSKVLGCEKRDTTKTNHDLTGRPSIRGVSCSPLPPALTARLSQPTHCGGVRSAPTP